MTSVNDFRAIFENLFEGSEVFDSLPNAKTQSKYSRKQKQKWVK